MNNIINIYKINSVKKQNFFFFNTKKKIDKKLKKKKKFKRFESVRVKKRRLKAKKKK
jgi:hypothetical protein